jgi:D-alanyl-D-alanine carboxypeptidase
MLRSLRWTVRTLAILLMGVTASLPLAAPPPTLVAPRAALLDPNDDDQVLMSKGLDSKALQGSIAKLMTAYTTSWAVKQGFVNWNDTVILSKRDTTQGCTCMKFQCSPQANTNCSCTSTTQVGEQFQLKNLLQVTLNQSTGESTDAIAEHVARKVYGLGTATNPEESDYLMNLFIGLMNERAKELHLDNSLWVTVHGGDTCDFSPGCNPQCKISSCDTSACPTGSQCNGGTSVHDLALLWHALTRDEPKFLGLIGIRAFELDQKDSTFYNSYAHGFGYYPGIDGDKNGGSGACPAGPGSISASCHIAQATRADHPLIASVLQSFSGPNQVAVGTNDVTAMFRWGYAQVLAPVRKVDAQLATPIKDHALACNIGQCFTALRTADDVLNLVVWNAAPEEATLAKLATGVGPSPISSLDVDANQLGTVVAVISAGKMVLSRWWLTGGPSLLGLPPNVQLKQIGDSGANGGEGTLVRVRLAGDNLAVTAVRQANGIIRLGTWKLGNGSSPGTALAWLVNGSSRSAPNLGASGELVLAVGADPGSTGNYLALTGDVTESKAAALQVWRVNGTSGAVNYVQSTSLGNGHDLSLANDGMGKFGVTWVTGLAASGNPRVEVWDVTHDGTFTRTMRWTETDAAVSVRIAPLGSPADKSGIVAAQTFPTSTNTFNSAACGSTFTPVTRISQRRAASFLTAAERGSGAQLAVWDTPVHYNEVVGIIGDYRLADSGNAWGAADDTRLAMLESTDPLLSQYVTQEKRSDGTLRLIGWQVGKPTPSHPHLSPPTPTPKPTPKPPKPKPPCDPCVCSDGHKAGPKVCEGSTACVHICRGHGH